MLKALDKWGLAYLQQPPRPTVNGPRHLLLCLCDHFELRHDTNEAGAQERLREWEVRFPKSIENFADADGIPPRHTFFYPIEQYDASLVERLSHLCRQTGAEVEIHLHHEGDTAAGLREKLEQGKALLRRHGWLTQDRDGACRFGFVHGDWALDHSHPEGRHCGVIDELAVLRACGCYADFTMPSAPSPTQSRIINRIYYARSHGRPRAFDEGEPVRAGSGDLERPHLGELLLVQGPLGLNWRWRKWGLLPRLENGDLTGANPPQPHRVAVWERLWVHVQGRPEWGIVKLHTHGGIPRNYQMLLGDAMQSFHNYLQTRAREGAWQLHYVTARELVNIIHAAEAGCSGSPGQYRNYRYPPPPALA
ncbi:MAG: hypothetical protein N3J91_05515 [Verrucomicrobiae bacterium]|nr:hypothetical protein [Verrucomicrobiae bacterium]